jgi:hypothetical protein
VHSSRTKHYAQRRFPDMASLAGLFRSLLLNPLYLLSSRVTALIHTLYDVCSKIIPYPWRILGHMQRQDQDLEKVESEHTWMMKYLTSSY